MSTAILLPGSASGPDFVSRAFAVVLADHDVSAWSPTGGDAAAMADQLHQYVNSLPADEPLTIVGVSVGAHAAALWASRATYPTARLVLALPAWTGRPGAVAAVTALAAQRIADVGLAAELAQLQAQFGADWVVDELVRAWRGTDAAQLVATLRATSTSVAPTLPQLSRITVPTVVVGLHDDPMHPWQVAREWAEAIVGAELVGLDRAAAQGDVGVFGRACLATRWADVGLGHQA